jgi:hypothetical protein
MIILAAALTGVFYAGGVWAYIRLPRWAGIKAPDGILFWYLFGWMVTLGAASVPTALMWQHL